MNRRDLLAALPLTALAGCITGADGPDPQVVAVEELVGRTDPSWSPMPDEESLPLEVEVRNTGPTGTVVVELTEHEESVGGVVTGGVPDSIEHLELEDGETGTVTFGDLDVNAHESYTLVTQPGGIAVTVENEGESGRVAVEADADFVGMNPERKTLELDAGERETVSFDGQEYLFDVDVTANAAE